MNTLRMLFEDEGLVLEFGAADRELNTFYDAAMRVYAEPKAFAISLDRVSEEELLKLSMRTYACGVALEWDPVMSEDQAYEWFVSHPGEFARLVEYADCRENFVDEEEDDDAVSNKLSGIGSEIAKAIRPSQ